MKKQFVQVMQSQSTQGPGTYHVLTPGITLTLETWSHWPDQSDTIVVKDMTGSTTPNITVNAPGPGSIDGLASISMSNQNEALVFRPFLGGTSWSISG